MRTNQQMYQDWKAKNPKAVMLRDARKRAKVYGVPCTITTDDFFIPTFCPVLGIELKVNRGTASNTSPSLDRFKPNLGYIPGNVAVVSKRANLLKNNATLEELKQLVTWLERGTKLEVKGALRHAPERTRFPWKYRFDAWRRLPR